MRKNLQWQDDSSPGFLAGSAEKDPWEFVIYKNECDGDEKWHLEAFFWFPEEITSNTISRTTYIYFHYSYETKEEAKRQAEEISRWKLEKSKVNEQSSTSS